MVMRIVRFLWDLIGPLRQRPRLFRFVVLVAGLPCFLSVVSFAVAVTPAEAVEKHSKPLPEGWTAGVMNHGKYYQWWPIGERPFLFTISWAGLIAVPLLLCGPTLWTWYRGIKDCHGHRS